MPADGSQAASGEVYVGGSTSSTRIHEHVSRGIHGAFLTPQQPLPVHE